MSWFLLGLVVDGEKGSDYEVTLVQGWGSLDHARRGHFHDQDGHHYRRHHHPRRGHRVSSSTITWLCAPFFVVIWKEKNCNNLFEQMWEIFFRNKSLNPFIQSVRIEWNLSFSVLLCSTESSLILRFDYAKMHLFTWNSNSN